MVSKIKKIIYSSLTIPIACITFSAFRWQWRRMDEKIIEIKQKTQLLNEAPKNIQEIGENPIEFTPVRIDCKIENFQNYFKVINTNDSSPGFRLIYCVKLKSNNRILVDFGWVPEDFNIEKEISEEIVNDVIISGVIYKGDKNPIKTHYDSNNNYESKSSKLGKNYIYFDLNTFINLFEKEYNYTNIIKGYCIKRVSLEKESDKKLFKSNVYPKLKTKNDLLYWYVTPEVHRSYYIFWFLGTFFNIASNAYVWLYL